MTTERPTLKQTLAAALGLAALVALARKVMGKKPEPAPTEAEKNTQSDLDSKA